MQQRSGIIENFNFFMKIIISSILFISSFGVLHFFFKNVYDFDIEIPYLTVNIKDFGGIDTKNNYRGDGIYKLVSTYSNGKYIWNKRFISSSIYY